MPRGGTAFGTLFHAIDNAVILNLRITDASALTSIALYTPIVVLPN